MSINQNGPDVKNQLLWACHGVFHRCNRLASLENLKKEISMIKDGL